MARTISLDDFGMRLLDKLELMDRAALSAFILEHAQDEIFEYWNNEIVEDWECEQIEDDKAYESLIETFKTDIEPGVVAQYGPYDYPALAEAWNNWTDALRKDELLTDGQYSNWANPY